MARGRRGRPVHGILVLDKPSQQSSNAALQTVKRLYNAAKAGHTGSLDPLATGVLPICFGEATKFSQYLLDSDKAYCSTFLLGVTTDTGDADGRELARVDASFVSKEQVEAALLAFKGDIEQIPSMFSAIKHNGQPLYKLARQGKTVERKPRNVTVHDIYLEGFRNAEQGEGGVQVDVYIHCSKGTYVRSIAEDLGNALGCGAHVKALRRVQAGPFTEQQCVSLATIQSILQGADDKESAFAKLDALLKPVDSALTDYPKAQLGDSATFYFKQGQAVQLPGKAIGEYAAGAVIRLEAESGDFLGIGEMLDDGRVSPKRLVAS